MLRCHVKTFKLIYSAYLKKTEAMDAIKILRHYGVQRIAANLGEVQNFFVIF